MDPDEPVLSAAFFASSVSSAPAAQLIVGDTEPVTTEDEARPVDAYDEEDDEDGAASVGRAAAEEDEHGSAETPSDALTAAEFTVADAPAPTRLADAHANGESVEAIEAAVANLALKHAAGGSSTDPPTDVLPSRTGAPTDSAEASTSDADDEGTLWHTYPKHFFILSSAGKPIYSYCGEDKSLVGMTALISALVSVVQSQGDTVQHIRSGSTLIVFMLHGPLYFVVASSVGEPATALKKQLELLYGQLVLIVTTGLERIIQRNPSYDVRSLLDGVGGVLSALVGMLSADASYLLGAYKPLPVPAADRTAITELLSDAVRASGAVYGLLMADTYIVAMSRAKQQPALHPDDLLLLANFVMCNNAYRHGHGEAFSPVCVPHYNSDAFLHAYIHYLDASSGLYLVLLSGSAEAFHQLSAARLWFEDQASARGLMPRMRSLCPLQHAGNSNGSTSSSGVARRQQQQQLNVLSVENLPRPLGGKFGHTPLWSYVVRFQQLQQAIISPPCPLHRSPAGAARLAASYTQLHSLLHSPAAPGRPNKMAWFASSASVLVAARDRDMELYLDHLCIVCELYSRDKVRVIRLCPPHISNQQSNACNVNK
ncbi:hypothetical protein VOLCADRAFT_120834 [Volvox carteri f. nagariensis]|uniref:Vacuolar fusion protein MON1 homolog n=1 Tax=Volvox carteri f. nagariensis TaxID=3068 RepID=D8TUF0_VOLCA|nr:uncharacterized protein VOLCADRAFT_120834 [Volvox carteri f. nagariensis]EFJ48696.1 hypothetical protein VOLCADRAFT_120834 [Volvox carteri f. nagariensis]|eukprot:XP_002950028.1 hypothetical protein VOLCADRAFT_120834 [Volvox carteri f. nagariensis]